MAGRTSAFPEDDGGWIVVATLLEQAAFVSGVHRETLLRDAIEIAEASIGAAALVRLVRREWEGRDPWRADSIIFLADAAHFAGALHVAARMFDSLLLVDDAIADVTRGRIMAKRARVAHKLSNVDEAAGRYTRLDQLGKRARIVELRIRAALGFVTIAQIRGNYPELGRFARRANRLAARGGFRELARQSRCGLMIAAAKAGRFEEALLQGWDIYEMSVGEPLQEAAVLANLGQLLLEAGDAQAARDAFASVVSLPLPMRMMLPGLGGLAVASATCGEEATVEWAEREALELSRMHGYHEVAYRAEALDTVRRSTALAAVVGLGAGAARVAASLRRIAPDELPAHVNVAMAGAAG